MLKVILVVGTRPEAIKLCPVYQALSAAQPDHPPRLCVTAQHRGMLDQVLEAFQIRPDYDLDVMQPGQTLTAATARMLAGLEPVLCAERPDMVLVQGDTTTTFCGALAAFNERIPVGHVEAGLRTWNLDAPFPEEANRVLTGRLASLHFAATPWAAGNLEREGVAAERIVVTGNPGIDAVRYVADELEAGRLPRRDWPELQPDRKLVLVTAHRRESFGGGIERICQALIRLAERPDTQIVYPVHPNPQVTTPVRRLLGGRQNILLMEPLSYIEMVDLMRRAWLLLTDSGGIQEEGPSLGKPVLVMRETTERPEAVEAGTVRLVGTDPERIVREAERLLKGGESYAAMSRVHNPYGDGRAGPRIAAAIDSFFRTK